MKHKLKLGLMIVAASTLGSFAFAAETLTDGQVAEVLITINDGEIDAAKLALKKSKNDDVRSYAATMEAQHKENKRTSKSIAKKAKLDDKSSELSKSLEAEAKTAVKDLKKAAGEFDKAYLAAQVKMHEAALKVLDTDLLPATTNADLKEHLQKTRTAVSEHLDHAKKLQTKFE